MIAARPASPSCSPNAVSVCRLQGSSLLTTLLSILLDGRWSSNPSPRQWDVAVYRQICLIIVKLQWYLLVLKGLSGHHMCAHPQICRVYFYPFTSIWVSYAAKTSFKTLFNSAPAKKKPKKTCEIFSQRCLPRKEQIIAFDPGVLLIITWACSFHDDRVNGPFELATGYCMSFELT